jgi:hypothetical protein
MDEIILEAIKDCSSGTLRLEFDIKDGEIIGCFGAAIGPSRNIGEK